MAATLLNGDLKTLDVIEGDDPETGLIDDVLEDSPGNTDDEIFGLTGNDIISTINGGNDFIDGGEGNGDTLDYSGLRRKAALKIDLDKKDGDVPGKARVVKNDGKGRQTDTFKNIENVDGHDGRDVMKGDDNDNTFNGFGGNDKLKGFAGDDTLDGGDKNDKLIGGDGDDTLLGGDKNDKLKGDDGADTLNGGAGNNHLMLGKNDGDIDTVEIDSDSGRNIVRHFEVENDLVDLSNLGLEITTLEELMDAITVENGKGGVVLDFGGKQSKTILKGVKLDELSDENFVFSDLEDFPVIEDPVAEDPLPVEGESVESPVYIVPDDFEGELNNLRPDDFEGPLDSIIG